MSYTASIVWIARDLRAKLKDDATSSEDKALFSPAVYHLEKMSRELEHSETLRDSFAMRFAEGLARHASWHDDPADEQNARLARTAYNLADAMLLARAK